MKKTTVIISFLFFFVSIACRSFAADAPAKDYTCALENEYMKRVITDSGDGVRTDYILNKLTGKTFDFAASGFRLTLDNGKMELLPRNFNIVGFKKSDGACEYELENASHGVRVTLTFTLAPGEPWTRERLKIDSQLRIVNEVDVERISLPGATVQRFDKEHESKPPWDWTGGRPIFVDGQLFMGLEYPAGHNEEVDNIIFLRHYPGRKGNIESKAAVIGVAADLPGKRVSDAFREYINKIRSRPPRRFILWNAYFNKYSADGGSSDTYSDSFLKRKFEAGRRSFIDVGVKPDCVLMDGGWTDPRSLMEEDRRAPERLGEVERLAKKYLEAPIGLHVITHGIRSSIEKKWLAENFDMIDPDAYCFADPRAADLEITNLLNIVGRYHPHAFKFDWGRFQCEQSGHSGHLPGALYSREAITDNHIRMLSALREADPDAFLYNTGWYSPWWLMYYEAVFSGEDDFNTSHTGPPSLSRHDIQITWRDAVIRRNVVEPGTFFPIEALMNHEPIDWKWTQDFYKPGHEPIESFADMILMCYLRGTGLIEFFLNVYNLSPDERRLWGQITNWAKSSDEILLADSRWIGGDPFKAEIYGYAHFTPANRGIIGLRNPGLLSKDFTFTLDENIGFKKNGAAHVLRISYPYEAPLGSGFKYGDTVSVSLERGQVMVIEAADAAAAKFPPVQPVNMATTSGAQSQQLQRNLTPDGLEGSYTFKTPAGLKASVVIMAKLASYADEKSVSLEAKLNGGAVKVDRRENVSGKDKPNFGYEPQTGWVLFRIELPEGDAKLDFKLTAPGAEPWGWLMTETPRNEQLPTFANGLPSAWASVVKSEMKLF